jgi:predicted kinase
MNKPLLIVVTGRPASGKTTLANLLSRELNLPLLSRDELKQGYITTTGVAHDQTDQSVDKHIYETFFNTTELLLTGGISIIVEAAFQHKLWAAKLSQYLDKADVKIVICDTSPELAKARFNKRLLEHPDRKRFHGDAHLTSGGEKAAALIEHYENVSVDAPTLLVDTSDRYNPQLAAIIEFVNIKTF